MPTDPNPTPKLKSEPEPGAPVKRKRRRNPDQEWEETRLDPIKGPKGDTDFLKDNYKFMQVGSIFRTPRGRFSSMQIHGGAARAGWVVKVQADGLWWKVTAVGKKAAKSAPKKLPADYRGAGKKYPA